MRRKGIFINLILVLSMLFTVVSGVQSVKANPYPGGDTNCTYTAWRLAQSEAGVTLPGWGNAKTWLDRAKKAGFSVGTQPKKKSIAVWTDSGTGHVAYVSDVDSSKNAIYIKEGGYGSYKTYHEGWTNAYGARKYSENQTVIGYIYLTTNVAPAAPQVEHGAPMETGGTQTIADGDYHIVAAENRWQCLTISAASTQNGANAQMWGCKEEDDQVFTVKYLGNGFYSIIYKKSGKYLDVEGNSTAIQTNVFQWEYTGAYAQQWVIRESGDGASYTIQARCSGYNLDMADGKTDNGTNVQVYKAHGGMAQRWLFIPWSKSVGKTLDDGEYQIYSKCSGVKGLSAEGNGQTAGNNVVLGTINGDKGQVFSVRYLPDGSYNISNKYSGLMLDIGDASLKRGATVHLWTPNGGDVQKWILKPSGGGYYNVVSRLSGKYLDLTDFNTADGTNIQVWDGNSTKAQEWQFVKWVEPVRKPDTKPVDSNNGQTSGTSGENEGQKPGNSGGNESQTPGTSGGNESQKPGTSGGNESQKPGTNGGNESQKPGNSGGNESQTPGTSGGNESQKPGTSGGNESQKPGTSGGNESQKPETSGGNESQKPGTSGGNESQKPGTSGGNESQTPGTSGGNNQPGTDSGNESGIIEDNPDDPTWFDPSDLTDGTDPDETDEAGNSDDPSDDTFYNVEWNVASAALQLGKSTSKVKAEVSEDDDIDKYISSNTSIVTVNDNGIITAKGVGKAVVRVVTEHGCTADVIIKVQKKAIVTKKIAVKSKNVRLKVGKTYKLGAQVTPVTSSQRITYKSSNSKIVAVNSKGKIKAKKPGKVTIRVKSGKKMVNVKVIAGDRR